MKIAQIAPLMESVPPAQYGGTERVISYLVEELVRTGHGVTLFASGDSITSSELVPCSRKAIRGDPTVRDPLVYYLLMLDRLKRRASRFDILPYRSLALSAIPAVKRPYRHHFAWPPGFAGPSPALPPI